METFSPIHLSVVVPTCNEGKLLRTTLPRIWNYLKSLGLPSFEVIVVNDGSTNGTLQVVEQTAKEIPMKILFHTVNRGKGYTVKKGVLEAKGDRVLFLDADLGIPIESLPPFLSALREGFDIAIASRLVPGARAAIPPPWYRRVMEVVFQWLRILIVADMGVKDTQCGFKVFTRQAAQRIFPKVQIERFCFDTEVIFLANLARFKIREIPFTLKNPRRSHIRIVRDSFNMLKDLVRIRINFWRGQYKSLAPLCSTTAPTEH